MMVTMFTHPSRNPRLHLPELRVSRAALTMRGAVGRAFVGVLVAVTALTVAPSVGVAQSVEVTLPAQNPLRTATPRFTVRTAGFGTARPFTIVLQVSSSSDFLQELLVDTTLASTSTVTDVQVTRVLPSSANIFWRAIVSTPDGTSATSPVAGPRQLIPWLALLAPNSPAGDILDTRRPLFVWRTPAIVLAAGQWRFDFELRSNSRTELTATLLGDTTFLPPTDLQANTSYSWSVRATAPDGTSVQAFSEATFVIVDPALPTTTILYQNFPNPFPSPTSFATCFWFDVGEPGAHISLDVLDIRGNLIRTIIPGNDGIAEFRPGRYGRGIPGLGNNCDNRFVWNGTGLDGRTVAAGAYLMRFVANNGRPIFRRILFKGR